MKRYAKSLTGLLLVSVLAGCGGDTGLTPAKETANRAGPPAIPLYFTADDSFRETAVRQWKM